MSEKNTLKVTAYGVWGFIFVLFGTFFFAVTALGLILSIIGLFECATGKKRGIGWPIAGLSWGIIEFITFIGSWRSLNEIDGYWAMNASFLGIILLSYLLFRYSRSKKDAVKPSVVMTNHPFPGTPVNPGSASPAGTASGTSASPTAPVSVNPAPGISGKTAAAAQRLDPETVRNEVNNRTEQLKEKLLAQEALRQREEEESNRQKRLDASRRKEFREKLLADAATAPPAEPDLLTLDGQRLIYKYASKMFPHAQDSEAGTYLMQENIGDAETMIETVSSVMGSLSENILESGSELKEYWETLEQRDLLLGIKAFSFYKEMSVGSEPFEIITDNIIDYLYNKEERK
ncbi:MAG: hypothetical protein E7240_03165 [Lachnospiraceae bacterium]|nr:hypothetical protein [Lachnospiraceae bacterium]